MPNRQVRASSRGMIFLASFVVIVGLATLSGKLSAVIAAQIPETPEATVRNAWSRAQQSGQYQFDTQIRQTVYPALSLGNVGESPRETYVTMRGETNLQTQLMQMSLRPEQGATAPEREQVDFKVQGDQSFIRKNGGAWQPSDTNVGVFAPNNDALAFLAAAKNIQPAGRQVLPEGSTPQNFARFRFDVDGKKFAEYSRDQMQQALERKGRLPGGITLGLNEQYEKMNASGLLWLDANGLPARIVMDVDLPQEASGARTRLKFSTNLDGYAPVPTLAEPTRALLGWSVASDEQWGTISRIAFLALFMAIAFALVRRRATHKCGFVRGVQAVLIGLLLIQPLTLQMRPALAYAAEQHAKRAEQQAQDKTNLADNGNVMTLEASLREAQSAVVLLRLDEAANTSSFVNLVNTNKNATCSTAGNTCPLAGVLGQAGSAARFDGVNDILTIESPVSLVNKSFTLAFWAKRASAGTDDFVISQGSSSANNGLHLGWRGNNKFVCDFFGNALETDTTYGADSAFHHWACSYDVTTKLRSIYRDGVLVKSAASPSPFLGSGNLTLGSSSWGGSEYFGGDLDEVVAVADALGQTDVQKLMLSRFAYADGTLGRGEPVELNASVRNELNARNASGLLEGNWDSSKWSGAILREPFNLEPLTSISVTRRLTVSNSASPGLARVDERAGAQIIDLRAQSGFAELWLKLDENPFNNSYSGVIFKDSSGNRPARNATCTAGACPQSNNGLYLDNAELSVSEVDLSNSSYTVFFRARRKKSNANQFIISQGSTGAQNKYLHVGWRANNTFTCDSFNNGLNVDGGSVDTEYAWVCVYDANANTRAIYRDGVLQSQQAASGALQISGTLKIGSNQFDANRLQGYASDVRLFRRALGNDEIATLSGAGGTRFTFDYAPQGSSTCPNGLECPQKNNDDAGLPSTAGSAWTFNGRSNAVIDVSKGSAGGSSFSQAFWVKPSSPILLQGWEGYCPESDPVLLKRYKQSDKNTPISTRCMSLDEYGLSRNWGENEVEGSGRNNEVYLEYLIQFKLDEGLTQNVHGEADDDMDVDVWNGSTWQRKLHGGSTQADESFWLGAGTQKLRVRYYEYGGSADFNFRWDEWARQAQSQALIGDANASSNRWQSGALVERVDNRLKVAFRDTNNAWQERTTQAILNRNTWQHVVITFNNGVYKFYVNGTKRDEIAIPGAPIPKDNTRFNLGADNYSGDVYVREFYAKDEGDGAGNAEICIAWRGSSFGGAWTGVDAGNTRNVARLENTNSHGKLEMWEEDGNENCNDNGSNDETLGRWNFSLADPAAPPMNYGYSGDGYGSLRLGGAGRRAWDVPSIPFNGKLADLRTMRYTLNDDQVRTLYASYELGSYFKLDEPPGAGLGKTGFKNEVLGSAGICDNSRCPTTGVQGRVQQGAYFDGVDDRIVQANTSGPDLANRAFSVAFWAKRASIGSNDIAVAQGNAETRKGLHIGFRDNNKFTCGFGAADLDTSASYAADTEFVQWVCTYDGSTRKIYRNGVQVASDAPSAYLGSGPLIIGDAAHFAAPFQGWLDDVRVYYTALDQNKINDLIASAPTAEFAFDEPLNSTSFANTTPSGNASCSGSTCPKAEVQGQIFNALEFDGVDDRLDIPDTVALKMSGGRFTLMSWVRLDGVNSANPIFSFRDNGSSGDTYTAGWVQSGYPKWYLGNSTFQASVQLLPNIWYHLAFMYDRDNSIARIFINGQLVQENTVAYSQLSQASPIAARLGNNHGSTYFKGQMDAFTVYNRALPAADIRSIFAYQQGLVSDRASQTVKIDTDPPSASINSIANNSYRKDLIVQVSSIASDTQSAVQLVDLALGKYVIASLPAPTWAAAQPCNGATEGAAWCAYISPTGEGKYGLQARAVDVAGNVQATPSLVNFFVDASAPALAISQADGATLRGSSTDNGRTFAVSLNGTVSDPNLAGGYAPSGVKRVTVSLARADGNDVSGSAAQTATLAGTTWSLSYILNGNATGAYTLTLSAEDNVENKTTLAQRRLNIDVSHPLAQSLLDASRVLSASGAITGSVNDPDEISSGVKQVQVQLEPVDSVPSNPFATVADTGLAVYLPLNASVLGDGKQIIPNAAFAGALDGSCALLSCPSYSSGSVTSVGNAANFGGGRKIEVPHDSSQAFNGNLSLALWVKPDYTPSGQVLLEKWSGGEGYALVVFNRFLVLYVGNGTSVNAFVADGLNANVWQSVAAVLPANGLPKLYIAGSSRALMTPSDILFMQFPQWLGVQQLVEIQALYAPAVISTGGAVLPSNLAQPLSVGRGARAGFRGQLDEVRVYLRALSASEITTLSSAPAPTLPVWQNATLGAANAQSTTWALSGVPAGLEGAYRINLRSEDNLGNLGENSAPPQIMVLDRQPPQIVAMTRTLDSLLGATRVRVQVQDRTPSNNVQIDVPGCEFKVQPLAQSNADSWTLGVLGKNNLPITGILASCVVSSLLSSPVTVTACDLAGQCTTSSTSLQLNGSVLGNSQPIGAVRQTYLGAGNGLSLSVDAPRAQSWLTDTATIALSGAVTATQSLRELGIYVNDARVYTQTWAQGAATSFSFAENYTPTGSGFYKFDVRAESYATTTTLALNENWEGFNSGDGFNDVSAPSNVWTKIVDRRQGAANEVWQVDNGVSTHSGANAVFFNAAANDVGDSARLQSPSFGLVGLPAPKLRFWLRHANLHKDDGVLVQVRVNSGAWQDLGEIIYPNAAEDCVSGYCWREHVLDLNDYSQYASLQIGFLAFSNGGEHIVLDDIGISSAEWVQVATSAFVNTVTPTLTVQRWNGLGLRGTISQTSNSQLVYVDVLGSDGSRDDNRLATVNGTSWTLAWQPARAPQAGATFTFTARILENEDVLASASSSFSPDVASPGIALPTVNVNAQGVVPVLGTMRDADVNLTTTLSLSESGTLRAVWYGWLLRERAPDLLQRPDGTLDIPLFSGVKRVDTPSSQMFTDTTFAQMPVGFGVDGGQRFFYVAAEDGNGNFSQQMFGPYVHDTLTRPDFVDLVDTSKPYLDWMNTGCTNLGYDDRSGKRQTLYMTRDQSSNVSLAWRGLDPAVDGDVFVYLENGANGTALAYNPFAATLTNTLMLLSNDGIHQMRANYALHIQGNLTATLVHYDDVSKTWQPEHSFGRYAAAGASVNGWFEVVNDGGEKVMIATLPLNLIANAYPNYVLGLATEKDGLRVWASVPRENPITSRRLARLAPGLGDPSRVQLGSQVYTQPCDKGGGGLRITLNVEQGVSLAKGDPNAFFVQAPLSMSLFASYSQTTAYTNWLNTNYCPANPEHPECIHDKQTSAKVQRQLLSELGDVDQPPLQPGQVLTAHFKFDFPGSLVTGNNTYFWFKLNSDAPVQWPNNCAFVGAQAGNSTAGTFNQPPYSPALDFNVPFTVGAQTVEKIWVTTYWNNINGVPSMGSDCGQSSPPTGTSFGDSVVMFTPDREAPKAIKVNSPLVMSSTLAFVRGTVIDLSPITAITLQVTAPGGVISQQVCPDANPSDGVWECQVDLVARNGGLAPTDGQTYGFHAIAQDPFGLLGEQSPGFLATVDTTPAEMSLTDETSGATLAAFKISKNSSALPTSIFVTSTQLQGEIKDNRMLGRVEVCDASGVCALADVTNQINLLPPTQWVFEDAPATSVPFGDGSDAANVCGTNTTGVVRTFNVTNTFSVGEIKVGVNIIHAYRGDVLLQLRSPQGTTATLFNGDGRAAQHVDALFVNDLKQAENFINVSDDPSAPYYDVLRASQEPLAAFIGASATGTWQLWVCDQSAAQDSGQFNRASLMLGDSTIVSQTRGLWHYDIPDTGNDDSVTHVFTVTAFDELDNAAAPLLITAQIDTVAPLITVTQVVTVSLVNSESVRAFSGTVSDGAAVSNVVALVGLPDGSALELPVTLDAGAWAFDLPRETGGVYEISFQAIDVNGNARTSAPYSVTVLAQTPVQLFFVGEEETRLGEIASFTARLDNPAVWPISGLITFTLPAGISPITLLSGTGVRQVGNAIVWQVLALTATESLGIGFSGVVVSDTVYEGSVLTVTGATNLQAVQPESGALLALNALNSNDGYAKIAPRVTLIDEISPTLTVVQLMTQTMQSVNPLLGFAGTVMDDLTASEALSVVAVITAPNGVTQAVPISLDVNGGFVLAVPIDVLGVYSVTIAATDAAGNASVAGVFLYTVNPAIVNITQLASIVTHSNAPTAVFTGTVVGGNSPISLTAFVRLPNGSLQVIPITINANGYFMVNLPAELTGLYQVVIKVQQGGNAPSVVGYYEYRVRRIYYLPLMWI